MSTEKITVNWRGINVYRNRKYEPLVDQLCVSVVSEIGKALFDFNKDLMVFAAIVGYKYKKQEPVENDSIQITLSTYATDEKDGYIYLLALLSNKNVECLRDENLHESVKIFEKYCNGGLHIIQGWLDEHPEDVHGVETLIGKMQEEYSGWEEGEEVEYNPQF